MAQDYLGFLGPSGTFSEEVALIYCRDQNREMKAYRTIPSIIDAVNNGHINEGMVPFVNSLEGGVAATHYSLIKQESAQIIKELSLPITHCLVSSEALELEDIKSVMSHPQAIQQCLHFIQEYLPTADIIATSSTADAASQTRLNKYSAAIASAKAADRYDLKIIRKGIEDDKNNRTRFVVLSREKQKPSGNDKTSLVISISDQPGSLFRVLGCFAKRNNNLTRIESRPSRRKNDEWIFFIDCEGHYDDPEKEELWDEIKQLTRYFKNLGSYPVGRD